MPRRRVTACWLEAEREREGERDCWLEAIRHCCAHALAQNLYILSEEQFAAIMQAAVSCFAPLLACLPAFFAVVLSL